MSNTLFFSKGSPTPLGSSRSDKGINFAVHAPQANTVCLLLYIHGLQAPPYTITLSSDHHRSGSIWHVEVHGHGSAPLAYHYFIDADDPNIRKLPLFDPYARALSTNLIWGEGIYPKPGVPPASIYLPPKQFDWEGISAPKYKKEDLIIYEAHVRGFTKDPSSEVTHPGSFLGVIEKIPYLLALGINAIEFLPIFEFDETENHIRNPESNSKLYNYWGYSSISFFAPMLRFSSGKTYESAIDECKLMIKHLHKNGIEVILDVVYNHTGEGGSLGPILSYKAFDNTGYYLVSDQGSYQNFSGTGNTFSCNDPTSAKLIVDSLCYWVEEFHIDGFRFDLASILTRGSTGEVIEKPLVLEMIHDHPTLKDTKLIAEPWDAAGLYQVGHFPFCWQEWNGRYRDTVRRFLKGDKGLCGHFATALCGSEDLFAGRGPTASINFITAHDGFTLYDLVRYSEKHNLSNGENNADGANYNDSWNCGIEGACHDPAVTALRQRQMYNFILALTLSQGTPMILMGDEYGHTREGNNNPYCHDDWRNWFQWEKLRQRHELFSFWREMIAFRKGYNHLLCKNRFLSERDIDWHGESPRMPRWDHNSSTVAFSLQDATGPVLYVAFNASAEKILLKMPELQAGVCWLEKVNTIHPGAINSTKHSEQLPKMGSHIELAPFSTIVAVKSGSTYPVL